ncbi:MAG: HPr(Ser) kinase/phosphatase [Faecalibacterium sp.]|nr:HPr(Ser) kinase/phosphatase [Ruminococcus sp.]MCM1391607.1 HPr(Ser) kinase/phosphatase [Ruminococcus sp.]MCM1485019.1 HPr(Ser) kinase/phosphatase [Faecalibacterium sp.]
MSSEYTVSFKKFLKDNQFEMLYMPKEPSEILIKTPDVNRPGLIFAGYENFFDNERLNFVGKAEIEFLKSLTAEQRCNRIEAFMSKCPAAVIVTRGLECPVEIVQLAPKYGVPLLRTTDTTSRCMATIIAYLNKELAERITRHGVFVEVYGEGVLILGDSGVGKSESAVELIKRGHRLIADDAVEIKKTSAKTLVGTAPDNIRHFIELRGIGIINARRIFGMGAVRLSKKIDMVIELEPWDSEKVYDRMGAESEYLEILGVKLPYTVVPVQPGRNLAIIIEVAAMNNRQKAMGYNAARELLHNLGMVEDIIPQEDELEIWGTF